jgi:hypothetical protein
MSAVQHQALVLGAISAVAFAFFLYFALSSRRTRFSVFAACNLLFVTMVFGAVATFDLSDERTEVVVAIMTELPVVLIVAWVCLALAGRLPYLSGTHPVEPAVRRARLRTLLRSAPFVLLFFVGVASVIGLVFPSPAIRVYAPAPIEFFVMKGLIMVPEALYSGLAALVFGMMAGRSSGLKRRLYFKNLAFSLGMAFIALIALESTIFAGVRVWVADQNRLAILTLLNTIETCLAISCIIFFALGLSMRYTPAVAGSLLQRLQTGWLHAQEQFESLEWRAVSAGAAQRLRDASGAVAIACRSQNLSASEMEKALATIRLVAVMKDPSSETRHITPEAARKLYELQEEILGDDVLASKISWAAGLRSRAREPQTVKSAPLHDALRAALDLIDDHGNGVPTETRPLWYWIAAVSAADAKIIDPSTHASVPPADYHGYRAAVDAYCAAKSSIETVEDHDRERRAKYDNSRMPEQDPKSLEGYKAEPTSRREERG